MFRHGVRFLAILAALVFHLLPADAAQLEKYLQSLAPQEFFQGADSIGPAEGEPPIAPVFKAGELLGYVYLNTDFTSAVGYSGKPIHIAVGIDTKGVVRGIRLLDHKEPIVLIGIPQAKVVAALNSLIDSDFSKVAAGELRPPQVDIVSGATVTVLVMSDSVVRSAVGLIRSGRLGNAPIAPTGVPTEVRKVDMAKTATADWATLIGDGSVRSLKLSVGEVTDAFRQAGHTQAANRPETDNPQDEFIQLYIAPVSVPSIGLSLLGNAAYAQMQKRLKPGQQAVLVAGDGAYSFKGSGYVRGGIFDRIELLQDGQGMRFRDRNHTRIGDLMADGAPKLREIALFRVPENFPFDVTRPFDLQLLVQRAYGARDKANVNYNLGYSLPDTYTVATPQPITTVKPAVPLPDAPRAVTPVGEGTLPDFLGENNPLWVTMW